MAEPKPETAAALKPAEMVMAPPQNQGRECSKPGCICQYRRQGLRLPDIGAKAKDGTIPRPTWESQRAYFGR